MTNNALHRRGGSESYLEVVSPELRRLGHTVDFFSPVLGDMARALSDAGFTVYDDVDALPEPDVIHGQHTHVVAQVRGRFDRVPLLFVSHSWFVPIEDPIADLGAAAYLCFNALTEERLRANQASRQGPVYRLTQPVTISQSDGLRRPIGDAATRAVAVSRGLKRLLPALQEACDGAGIAFDWVGGPGRETLDPGPDMRSADIVFAIGRTALEAMAMGRAVAILDETNFGGWVTSASYPELEANGFTGSSSGHPEPALDELLVAYDSDLGRAARSLVVAGHVAAKHAVALLEIYASIADTRTTASPAVESVALLAQERHAFEARAVRAEWDAAALRRRVEQLTASVQRLEARNRRLRRKVKGLP
jgi:hypothetical protein